MLIKTPHQKKNENIHLKEMNKLEGIAMYKLHYTTELENQRVTY